MPKPMMRLIRLENRIQEFAHEIPFNELFSYIKTLSGIEDLSFNLKFIEGKDGLRPEFESQDLVDKVGFLKLIFSEIHFRTFSSQIVEDKPRNYEDIDQQRDYPLYYWCTVALDYNHPGGGSNGKTFLTAWYSEESGWKYQLEGE